jgi:hypothetical protein
MELKLVKSTWGMTGSLEDNMKMIAEAGYEGVEAPLPWGQEEEMKELLAKYQLDYIIQVFTGDDHIASFEEQVEKAKEFNPLLIVSHSAKDSMPYDQQLEFFDKALAIEKSIGIPVGHETHRQRAMFTPWTTANLLKDLKDLKITADFSHWCCVCESLLHDQEETLSLAFERTIHIHGRVGYAEGPQVTDPRAPEFAHEVELHQQWWDQICKYRANEGAKHLTFTPEFGPPGYMHTLPFTGQPVADLWDVCLWMGKKYKQRFDK